MIDASKFSVNERNGEYYAEIDVRGSIRFSIKADSIEEARQKADSEADRLAENEFDIQLNEVDDLEVTDVRAEPKLYRVWAGESKMQVSRLTEAYTPANLTNVDFKPN
jgi:hypothetical protein